MTGGAIGSLFAQCFSLSAAERKTLLVAGATAGMTAIFGTPIAAVLLAVELLLFEWKPRSLIPVITACAVSSAWRPFILGTGALAADVGRVPVLDRKTSRLVGLVSRKDLLRIRATAKSAEADREAYFARRATAPAPEREPA